MLFACESMYVNVHFLQLMKLEWCMLGVSGPCSEVWLFAPWPVLIISAGLWSRTSGLRVEAWGPWALSSSPHWWITQWARVFNSWASSPISQGLDCYWHRYLAGGVRRELRGVCFLESALFLFQHLRGHMHTYAPASLTSRRMIIFPVC